MAVYDFFTSRNNGSNIDSYIGHPGRLFYSNDTGVIRISDGVTPGGLTIPYTVASNTNVGGIKAGPGVVISNEGELYIDSANLTFSFGNFTASNNILTIVNADENMILETSGNAEIQLVGNIGFYKTNDGGAPDPSELFFYAQSDGQITIFVPEEDPIAGGVEIIGSATGNFIAPGTPGTMLHLTGNPDVSCRLYQDSIGSYSSFVGRRFNGNVASPTQVLAGQDVLRFNATAATDAGVGNVALAQISITALEDQTTTAQGSEITFTVTPIGSAATSRVDVANITVANGVTATKFTTSGNITAGNLTVTNTIAGNVSGSAGSVANALTAGTYLTSSGTYDGGTARTFAVDATTTNTASKVVARDASGDFAAGTITADLTGTASTATNLTAATSILAGSLSINPTSVGGTTSSTQTFTLTGLTTNHKVVITSGTALNAGFVIQAAWASALNTISIQFYNTNNQPIDAGTTAIQYFAWV